MKDMFLNAPAGYEWPMCAEAEGFIIKALDAFLEKHAFGKMLSKRMSVETSTRFFDWVDHVALPEINTAELRDCEFEPDPIFRHMITQNADRNYWHHPHAQLPRIYKNNGVTGVAIKVDSILDFQLAHALEIPIVHGKPYGGYRSICIHDDDDENLQLIVIERRGHRYYHPVEDSVSARGQYIEALEMVMTRRRKWEENEEIGMEFTLKTAELVSKRSGPGMAACAFLEAERKYWQARNTAGTIQKGRQDRLGLGWGNRDHHTFRSSRKHFAMLIKVFLALGFKKRERFYAGAEAGWGAQVMEHPDTGDVIFADVDLLPDETEGDFAKVALPETKELGMIGLWCGLHGESILQAGMHHLEAQFNFDHLNKSMEETFNIVMMEPFSDFPHLRQAFTKGEQWVVREDRLEALVKKGSISEKMAKKFADKGAIGSHLENLQRRLGFKGFNQKGVSSVLKELKKQTLEE